MSMYFPRTPVDQLPMEGFGVVRHKGEVGIAVMPGPVGILLVEQLDEAVLVPGPLPAGDPAYIPQLLNSYNLLRRSGCSPGMLCAFVYHSQLLL